MSIKIETFHISTSMGQVNPAFYLPGCDKVSPLPFLTKKELEEFNTIGYTGKRSNGKKTTYQEYLNSLNKGTFDVTQTAFDSGTYQEKYTIVRAYNK